MTIRSVEVGVLGTNCYIVCQNADCALQSDADSTRAGECVIVDPGDDVKKLVFTMNELKVVPTAILLTHGHFDHIGAVAGLREEYPGIRVYAGRDENPLLHDPELNLTMRLRKPIRIDADRLLDDNESFNEAGIDFRTLATPGHTMGSVCYYSEEEKVLFAGDTLFMGSMGRTDFPTGNEAQIFRSLKMLAVLPDDTIVYPGHGPKTSIGEEKRNNPYMQM